MADVEEKERDRGGQPPDYDWAAIKEYALAVVKERGMPSRTNKRLPSKEQLIKSWMLWRRALNCLGRPLLTSDWLTNFDHNLPSRVMICSGTVLSGL